MIESITPRIWIGSLGEHVKGRLLGMWFDADAAPADARDWAEEMYRAGEISPPVAYWNAIGTWLDRMGEEHEELRVFDHDGFDGFLKGECDPATAVELAEWLEELDANSLDRDAVRAWLENFHETWQDFDSDDFQDAYTGVWDDGANFAEEEAFSLDIMPDDLPDWIVIDWEASWDRNLRHDYWTADAEGGGIHIFREF